MIISVPAALLFLNWLGTMWRGAIAHDDADAVLRSGLVFVFGLGGLTGLYLADIVADIYLHDTYFVVGHFHLIMAAAVLLASFAAIYFWFPKMFGRMMSERARQAALLARRSCRSTSCSAGSCSSATPGMQRRLYDPSAYDFLQAPPAAEPCGSRTRRSCSARRSSSSSCNFFCEPAPRQGRRQQPVGGRHARVDGRRRRRRTTTSTRSRSSCAGRTSSATRDARARGKDWLGAGRGAAVRPRAHGVGRERARRDASVGMVVFLGACAMLFAALLFAYAVVRAQAPAWPPPGTPPFPRGAAAINGLLLIASRLRAAARARRAGRPGRPARWRWARCSC